VSKNLKILFIALLALAVAAPAMAAKFTFHGDFDNRFTVFTDQMSFFSSNSPSATELNKEDSPDSFGSAKYRLWMTASTNDGKAKAVYAIELGAFRYGQNKSQSSSSSASHSSSATPGGDFTFSGDGINIETRWAYTDFQLPTVDSKARIRMGLFTNKVNKYFWAETASGIKFYTDNWYVAWLRGDDAQTSPGGSWGDGDLDTLTARYDLKMEPVKAGFFASYFWQDITTPTAGFTDLSSFNSFASYALDDINTDLSFFVLALGVDGSWSTATNNGKLFINWDLIYETGSFDDVSVDGVTRTDLDLNAYFLHADIGLNFGKATLTYTVYYASGDDNSSDNDLDGWMGADTDATTSVIFDETYTNDDYFSDRYYIADKGFFLNKLALDYKVNKKTKCGVAVLYMQTAEDMVWDNATDFGDPTASATFADDSLGVEFNAYVAHKLYKNLEASFNIAFLSADDALDAFEPAGTRDGSGDVDIFRSSARLRYEF
jgi:hypothetical protein